MGVSRDRTPTEANGDVRTPEIGRLNRIHWDPAEDWGENVRWAPLTGTSGAMAQPDVPAGCLATT
jgi:hypothetical protein